MEETAMADILRRAWSPHLDLEIRGDGRTVYGLAVPFDSPTPIRDRSGNYDEVFRMGAFTDTIRERGDRVKFLANHDRQTMPLGKAIMLREDPAGLIGEFRVSATPAGDAALELIRDGVLDALSIGFAPIASIGREGRDPVVERTAVKLMEVSAVAFPAYEGAMIAGVRSEDLDGPDQPVNTEPDQLDAPDQRIHRARALALLDIDNLIRRITP
jgi:HK97 family phage prohead protease